MMISRETLPLKENPLSSYGTPIASYQGEGTLTAKDGQKLQCMFAAGQLTNGTVLLLCEFSTPFVDLGSTSSESFEGVTTEGYQISTSKHLADINYLPPVPRAVSGAWTALHVRELSVRLSEEPRKAHSVHFGVVNFDFTGTPEQLMPASGLRILPLHLKTANSTLTLSIVPLKDKEVIVRRLTVRKAVEPTCEIVLRLGQDDGVVRPMRIVDNLCYLMSIAKGTKIQWIYCDEYDKENRPLLRKHWSRVTNPYCWLPIIDPSGTNSDEIKSFLENTYPIYVEKRHSWNLNKGVIDAYLDAKAKQDYWQLRGAKLAVAMEMLTSVFLHSPDSSITDQVLPKEQFKALRKDIEKSIREVLKEHNIDGDQRGKIYDMVPALNRTSFKAKLEDLFASMGLEAEERNMKLFINSRNKLVHEGLFYCEAATNEESEKCPPLLSMRDEYFFLVDFLDRTFLRLLEYDGPSSTWRDGWPSPRSKL